MQPNYPKLIFAILAAIYFLWIAYDPMEGSFLDLVDLPIHETGHLLFQPFGQFMAVAGGTIFQIFFPAVFVGYFIWQGKAYSASMVLFWVGQSMFHVWVYAADAVVMQLMLTSGMTGSEGGFHDWNYMLTEFAVLHKTKTIAGIIRVIGTLITLAAAVLSIYYSFVPEADSDLEL